MKYLLIFVVGLEAAAAKAKEPIVINLEDQQLYLYKDNKIVFSTRVSTGRHGMVTPAGHFAIDLKKVLISRSSISYDVTLLYAVEVNPPIGIHYAHDPGCPG